MRTSSSGISLCRVRYGEDMKLSESSQSSDPGEAREDASFLAMIQVQSQYPNCFLVSLFFFVVAVCACVRVCVFMCERLYMSWFFFA